MNATTAALASSPSPPYRNPTRVMTSLLAPVEKRALQWLADRLPSWVHSDHLTGLALVAMLCAGLSFWLASVTPLGLVAVVVCLAVNWFGDSLDGTLARLRRQERPRYGYYVDHVVDLSGTAFLLGGLALSGYMTPLVAMVLLAAYFMLSAEIYLAVHSVGRFTLSLFGCGPTELRIVLAMGTLMLAVNPTIEMLGRTIKLFDVGGVVAIAGLLIAFLVSAISTGRELFLAEPRPVREPGS